MNTAVAYCRVSTKNQQSALKDHQEQWIEIFEREGFEFANCGVFYKKNGYKEPKKGLYVDEGISAKEYKKHRKAFQQMIEDAINNKFRQIVVEDTTRFARSIEDGIKVIKDLREKGVDVWFRKENLHSIDTGSDTFLSLFFTLAENEIRTDSNRIKWKQEKLHKAGKWTAPAPYGYAVEKGILSINEKEKEVVDYIFYLYTEKLLGMRAIANILNGKGIRTRKGNLWKSTEIRYILENRIYIGDIVTHKTESVDITRGTYKKIAEGEQIIVHNEKLRIISDEVWKEKDKIKNERNKRFKNREGYSTKHLLSTLLYCEKCGSTYIRIKKKDTKDKERNIVSGGYEWTCLGHNHYGDIKCKGRYALQEDELIEAIKKELKKEQKRDRKVYLDVYIKKKGLEIKDINIEEIKEKKKELHKQMIELRTEKKVLSEENYNENLKIINSELDTLRIQEQKYKNIKDDIEKAETKYNERCELLKKLNFNKLNNIQLKQIFNKIKINGEYREGYKEISIHFGYNFLDETITELGREFDDIEHSAFEGFVPYQKQKIRKSTKTRYFK
ncbi:MAG: recombinase family protein [Clostridia bacterium]